MSARTQLAWRDLDGRPSWERFVGRTAIAPARRAHRLRPVEPPIPLSLPHSRMPRRAPRRTHPLKDESGATLVEYALLVAMVAVAAVVAANALGTSSRGSMNGAGSAIVTGSASGPPGQSGTAPGQAGATPGQSGTTPAQGSPPPGQSGTTPGQGGGGQGKGKGD